MQGTGTSSLRQPLQSSSGRLGRIASLRAQIATPALHPKETQFNPEGRHLICPKFTSKLKYCFRRLSSLCIWARPLMIARNTEISFNTRDRRLFELTTAQPKETESRPSAPTPPTGEPRKPPRSVVPRNSTHHRSNSASLPPCNGCLRGPGYYYVAAKLD